jgi:hypothetical protein
VYILVKILKTTISLASCCWWSDSLVSKQNVLTTKFE